MSDTDNSSYLLRYNLISQAPEFFVGSDWYAQVAPAPTLTLTNGRIYVGNSSNVATGVAMSGDATIINTGALTLATVNSNVGTFASVTVNGKGLVTAAANLTGDITSSSAATTLATVNSNVGSFTSANITVNAKGLITAATNGGGAQTLPQVVFAVGTTQYSNTSATYVGVGPTASITLQKSTNKVKVTVTGALGFDTLNGRAAVTIKRDSTDLDTSTHGLTYIENLQANAAIVVPCSITYVDAPGDTSAHTYQAFAKYVVVSTGVQWGAENTQTTITLEEILS